MKIFCRSNNTYGRNVEGMAKEIENKDKKILPV